MTPHAFWTSVAIWISVVIFGGLLCVEVCSAERLDEATRLDLARCLVSEADWHAEDWAPIAHVLQKRQRQYNRNNPKRQRTYRQMIHAYCAVFAKEGRNYYRDRTKNIRESTWDKPLHGNRQQWQTVKRFVNDYSAGKIPDPCKRCLHWGSSRDVIDIGPSWLVVDLPGVVNYYLEKKGE